MTEFAAVAACPMISPASRRGRLPSIRAVPLGFALAQGLLPPMGPVAATDDAAVNARVPAEAGEHGLPVTSEAAVSRRYAGAE